MIALSLALANHKATLLTKNPAVPKTHVLHCQLATATLSHGLKARLNILAVRHWNFILQNVMVINNFSSTN